MTSDFVVWPSESRAHGTLHTRGGPYGIGGILGVVLIVWLLRGGGYVGGF